MTKYLEAGQKFGKLTVVKLERTEQKVYKSSREKSGIRKLNLLYYLCKCDCGNYTVVEKSHLTKTVDNTKTCGCSNGTHHKRDTRLYHIFHDMKKRCYNPNSKSYKDYGARGVKICDEWLNDFMSFYNWAMANGYDDTLTIERIDINKIYEPSNCKWIPKAEQSRNRRGVILIEHNNETKPLSYWCEKLNIKHSALYAGIMQHYPKYANDFKIVGRL